MKIILLLFLLMGAAMPTTPDLSKGVQLMGRSSSAQACPVAPDAAFTAAHAIDPGRDGITILSYRWQQNEAHGITKGWVVISNVDLAIIQPDKPFPSHYKIAKNPPKAGDTLWMRGYDFRKRDNAYASRDFKVEVLRVVAGHIIVKPTVDHGTSGACMLTSDGEVVGIVVSGKPTADEGVVAVGVGVWEGVDE